MRQKILPSAFMRAVKDPFPPARQAGILAIAANHNFFTLRDSSARLLPTLCSMAMDPDKGVRDQVCNHNHEDTCIYFIMITVNDDDI